MGTKNNPGAFDCYANAKPDEPMFVLLGRDPCAPVLVELWSEMRRVLGEDPSKVAEALACVASMKAWLKSAGKQQANISVGLRWPADMHDTCHPDTYDTEASQSAK